MDHRFEGDAPEALRQFVGGLGLPQIPRKAVEHIATVATRLNDLLGQHGEDQIVGHEVAAPQEVGSPVSRCRCRPSPPAGGARRSTDGPPGSGRPASRPAFPSRLPVQPPTALASTAPYCRRRSGHGAAEGRRGGDGHRSGTVRSPRGVSGRVGGPADRQDAGGTAGDVKVTGESPARVAGERSAPVKSMSAAGLGA